MKHLKSIMEGLMRDVNDGTEPFAAGARLARARTRRDTQPRCGTRGAGARAEVTRACGVRRRLAGALCAVYNEALIQQLAPLDKAITSLRNGARDTCEVRVRRAWPDCAAATTNHGGAVALTARRCTAAARNFAQAVRHLLENEDMLSEICLTFVSPCCVEGCAAPCGPPITLCSAVAAGATRVPRLRCTRAVRSKRKRRGRRPRWRAR